jgi:polysaccharide pyruvyl transferase WcaK-like protein
MDRRTRIALWGNFGTANWGNECTLQAILRSARERLPEAELMCICSEPDDTTQRHRLPAVQISAMRRLAPPRTGPRPPRPIRIARRAATELREWVHALRVARKLDMIIMTGTGMLTDDAEGPFGLPYDMFKWALAAKVWGGKLSFVSVGVEPIRNPLARFFITTSLRLADYRSYRDAQSREHLVEIGFAAGDDEVYPDLAFSLPERPPRPAANGDGRRKTVAVGVYSYRFCGEGGEGNAAAYRDYLNKLARFVGWLIDQGHLVRLIIGDLTYDRRVLDDLRRLLASAPAAGDGRIVDEPAASVDDVIRQIAEADIVVASRFHNVLLALFMGKPVVSISYNVKNEALMAEMGLAEYCQTIDELDVDRLIAQFISLEREAARLQPAIVAKAGLYRHGLEQQYQALFSGIG